MPRPAGTGSFAAAAPTPVQAAPDLASTQLDLPGTPDLDQAQQQAQQTLNAIDWSRPNIALYVPGTDEHSIPLGWQGAVGAQFPAGSVSQALVDYPATLDFNPSVATGMETVRLVLAGIAQREQQTGQQYNVNLAGYSQGAWVVGKAMENPSVRAAVSHAVVFGDPSGSVTQTQASADPKLAVIDHPDDPVTQPVQDAQLGLAAIDKLLQGDLSQLDNLGTVAEDNPQLVGFAIDRLFADDSDPDPHDYTANYAQGARDLASGGPAA
jgi:hypothetical protein